MARFAVPNASLQTVECFQQCPSLRARPLTETVHARSKPQEGTASPGAGLLASQHRCDCMDIPSLPEKWDQPVPDSLRIGVVALQSSPQELFLDQLKLHYCRREGVFPQGEG